MRFIPKRKFLTLLYILCRSNYELDQKVLNILDILSSELVVFIFITVRLYNVFLNLGILTLRTTATTAMSDDQKKKRKQKETNRNDNVQQVFLHKQ